MAQLPDQRRSTAQKTDEWGKDCVNALISYTNFGWLGSNPSWRQDIHTYYDMYNGIIDDADYTHVLKPYGKDRQRFPAKLHNYPIIKPIVDLLLGEKVKRPRHYSVVVANDDVIDKKKEAIFEAVKKNLMEHFVRELQTQMPGMEGLPAAGQPADPAAQMPPQMGQGMPDPTALQGMGQPPGAEMPPQGQAPPVQAGQPPQEAPPPQPEEVAEWLNRNYKDHRAVQGQKAVQYMRYDLRIDQELLRGWKDWLISGLVFSYKDIIAGDMWYEILNPLDVDYDKSPDTEFIEDGEWAALRKIMTPSDVVKHFWNVLKDEQIDNIYKKVNDGIDIGRTDSSRTDEPLREEGIEVLKVFWKSLKKMKVVLYEDEWGIIRERDEEEEYTPGQNEKATDVWVPEVWEGTRINGTIYVHVRSLPVQRNKLNQRGECKLPINGRKYSDRNSPNISLVSLGVSYQLTYNIYKYRLENEVAKAKGMIAQIDLSLVPADWDLHKFMYYMEAAGIAFYQSEVEGVARPSNTHKQVLDLSVKAIESYVGLLGSILDEWERLSGVTRQRQGMMSPYDGKGTSEQSIIQSSNITEDMFARYEEFEAKEYQGLLDLSKVAYIHGTKGMYVTPEGREAFLEVDGETHAESDYGIFVVGGAREQEKLETLKMYGQQLASSGNVPVSLLATLIEAESFVILKEQIQKIEDKIAEDGKAQSEADQKQQQMLMEMEQKKMEVMMAENKLDRENRIQVAMISAGDGTAEHNKLMLDSEKLRLDDARENKKIDISRSEADILREQISIKKTMVSNEAEAEQKRLKLEALDRELHMAEIEVKRIAANKKPASPKR